MHLAAHPSVVTVALFPLGAGAGAAAPMGGTREHPAWPAGLDVPASLLAAPPSGVAVDLLSPGGGPGAAVPMRGNRENRGWRTGLDVLDVAGPVAPMGVTGESGSKVRGLRSLPCCPSLAISP